MNAYALVAAAGAILAALTQVVVGFLSDRRRARVGHRREFYLIGLLLALPSLVAFYLAPTYASFVLAFMGLQIGMNVFGGPYQAAVPDHVPPSASGTASAWMSGYQFVGQCIGLVIAAFVIEQLAGFEIAAILAITFAITFVHLRRLGNAGQSPLGKLRIDRNFRTVLVSRALINLGFYTFVGFLFFFVHDVLPGSDARQTTGILFLAFTIAGVLGAFVAGRASDRTDKRTVVSIAGAAIAVTLAVLSGAQTLAMIFISGALAGVAWGAFFTADWAIAYVVLPPESMAAAMGVWSLAAALPQIVAPLLGAAIAGFAGNRAVQVAVIVEFLAGTIWLWRLPPLRGQTLDRPTATVSAIHETIV